MTWEGEEQRERETENPKQGGPLAQSLMQGLDLYNREIMTWAIPWFLDMEAIISFCLRLGKSSWKSLHLIWDKRVRLGRRPNNIFVVVVTIVAAILLLSN